MCEEQDGPIVSKYHPTGYLFTDRRGFLTNERHTDDTTSFLCDALTRTHIISKALLPKMHILTLTRRKQIQNVTLQNVNVIGGGRKARNCSRLQTTKEIQLNVVGS